MKTSSYKTHPNVNVRFELSLFTKIKTLAKANERSTAAQIRHMLTKLLEKEK